MTEQTRRWVFTSDHESWIQEGERFLCRMIHGRYEVFANSPGEPVVMDRGSVEDGPDVWRRFKRSLLDHHCVDLEDGLAPLDVRHEETRWLSTNAHGV